MSNFQLLVIVQLIALAVPLCCCITVSSMKWTSTAIFPTNPLLTPISQVASSFITAGNECLTSNHCDTICLKNGTYQLFTFDFYGLCDLSVKDENVDSNLQCWTYKGEVLNLSTMLSFSQY